MPASQDWPCELPSAFWAILVVDVATRLSRAQHRGMSSQLWHRSAIADDLTNREAGVAEASRILIVGGGIAGLSAAIALADAGYSAELVESRADWPVTGAAITMHANGVRALGRLGLASRLRGAGAVLPKWSFHDAQGNLLCATDLADLWSDVGPCLGVTRVELQRLLVGRARETAHQLGVAVTALTQGPAAVTVQFSDGGTGDFDLVVGADGLRSMIRMSGVSGETPQYAGTMAWRSVCATRPSGLDCLQLMLGDGRFFGLVPVGGGGTYGFAGIVSDRFDDPVERRLDRFRERFADFDGLVPAYLEALGDDDPLHSGPVEWISPGSWHQGRVVLIGDAAHAAPPHMGEGGSLAIEDALVLAEVIQNANTIEAALQAYEVRRRPRVNWVQTQSLAAARAWGLPPAVRDGVLRERGDQMLRERYWPLRANP
jgi:2-polyprenyl-6-methoxyphenol hydroxylase-like FAD-dependent oxidoreductase